MLEITVNADVRNFKVGDEFKFQFDNGCSVMVGENGSGKSTITNAIRGHFMSLDKAKGVGNSLNNYDIVTLSKSFDVKTDYDYCFVIDFHLDNPLASNNAYDAVEFLMNGGYAVKDKSHGECSLHMLGKLLQQLDNFRAINKLAKILLILDEPESGMSIKKQFKLASVMIPGIIKKHNVDMLIITHNTIITSSVETVFDMETKQIVPVNDYIYS